MTGSNLPYIPEYVTVHLGPPDTPAQNVTVSFVDYIKNVASSEIYPTWPESALRANIYAQISFALNKIYTEYYRSRGYDFDITNSTTIDQAFVYGRDIFENISQIVDEIFNTYVRKVGSIEPYFTEYCNGTTVTCPGLSQWGTVALAEQGLGAYDILAHYYGDDIELVSAPVMGITPSLPDRVLEYGMIGNDVQQVQLRLNRISKNYPLIPKINPVTGFFGPDTEAAVRQFQSIFNLDVDGRVGKATWYRIALVYNAVKKLSELDSEGIPPSDVTNLFQVALQEGDTGHEVRELQYFLAYVANFEEAMNPIAIDGIFGPATRQAVIAFQQLYGLEPTGILDTRTWDYLYRAYRGIIASLPTDYIVGVTAVYPGYPLRLGSEGDAVTLIQEYLNYISNIYTSIPKLDVDGIFGVQTQSAVQEYQRLFGIEQTGIVAAATWNSITDTYDDLYQGAQASIDQFPGTIG